MKKLLLFTILLSTCAISAQNRESDSLALVEIFNALDGDNWTNNNNWLTESPIDDWHDVDVWNNRVTELKINNNNASGDFPIAIYNLTALQELSIALTSINGPIPPGIGALSNLRDLNISNCGITGDLPDDFGALAQLQRISLPINSITGSLPELGDEVYYISLRDNQFTGPIPQSWVTNNVRQVRIDNNNLTGSLDPFGDMLGLSTLSPFNNDWDPEPMPVWLDDLPELRSFQCMGCNLVGDVPEYDFSNSPEMYQIIVSHNSLSGDIENLFLSPLDEDDRMWLDVKDNNFEGELPLHMINKVGKLVVDENNFSSITEPAFNAIGTLNLVRNHLTITDLLESMEDLFLDSLNIYYGDQDPIGVPDSLIVTEESEIMLDAREHYPGVEYQWTRFNQEIDGATESTYAIPVDENTGEFFYDCILTYPLFTESDGYKVKFYRGRTTVISDFTSSVNDVADKYNVSLLPIPAVDRVFIKSDLDFADAKYQLLSMTGRLLNTGFLSNEQSIDISTVLEKLMILKIESQEGIIIKKVVKR